MPGKGAIQSVQIFFALSEACRLRIVRLMLSANDELCLCELSESLDEPEYKLSRHVKILKSSGLLNSVRDGKWIYHSLVQTEECLRALYHSLALFPDLDRQYERDFKRFEKRRLLRTNGRCVQASGRSKDATL